VLNNPLKYTDPSGYFLSGLFKSIGKFFSKWGRVIVAIAAAAIIGPWAAGLVTNGGILAAVVGGAAAGFVAGGIMTGSWQGAFQGALFGAITGGMAWQIGYGASFSWIRELAGGLGRHIAHGVANGLVAVARGGKFRSGFWGGLFGSAAPVDGLGGEGAWGTVARTVAAAVVGGTAAVLGGGKFGNGAVSAAFAHLFGGGGARQQQGSSSSGGGFFSGVLDVVGKIWALPNTIVGMIYGGVGHVAGWIMGTNPQIVFDHNAIQFINNPFIRDNEALTLGNAILYGENSPPWKPGAYGDNSVNIGFHEEAHTYQYQVLGPFYAPAYLLNGGFSGPSGNPLEQAAQVYGRNRGQGGWWPW
jgi:hypothetical protein